MVAAAAEEARTAASPARLTHAAAREIRAAPLGTLRPGLSWGPRRMAGSRGLNAVVGGALLHQSRGDRNFHCEQARPVTLQRLSRGRRHVPSVCYDLQSRCRWTTGSGSSARSVYTRRPEGRNLGPTRPDRPLPGHRAYPVGAAARVWQLDSLFVPLALRPCLRVCPGSGRLVHFPCTRFTLRHIAGPCGLGAVTLGVYG